MCWGGSWEGWGLLHGRAAQTRAPVSGHSCVRGAWSSRTLQTACWAMHSRAAPSGSGILASAVYMSTLLGTWKQSAHCRPCPCSCACSWAGLDQRTQCRPAPPTHAGRRADTQASCPSTVTCRRLPSPAAAAPAARQEASAAARPAAAEAHQPLASRWRSTFAPCSCRSSGR